MARAEARIQLYRALAACGVHQSACAKMLMISTGGNMISTDFKRIACMIICIYIYVYIYMPYIYIYAVCLKIHTGPERQRLSSFVSKKFNDSNHRYFPIQSPRLELWEHLHSHPLKMGGSSEGLPVDFL